MIIKSTSRTEFKTVIAPTKRSPPNARSSTLQAIWTTPFVNCMTKPVMPRASILPSTLQRSRMQRSRSFKIAFFPSRKQSTHAALHA